MRVLITGAAGFIGMHMVQRLLKSGHDVTGFDNLNAYYDSGLKKARLERLNQFRNFSFIRGDLTDKSAVTDLLQSARPSVIMHLAAQAGVRYSLQAPEAYVEANVLGHTNLLEAARQLDGLDHLVYASSSSVYGDAQAPFREDMALGRPKSIYAATKRAGELVSDTYAGLYGLPQTGLRFFTVYGPWGRPDMAPWLFTEAILRGEPIKLYNHGRSSRDFTYIDDVVAGMESVLPRPPGANAGHHVIYNIGNRTPVDLPEFVHVIERITGKKATKELHPMQPGDVERTCADITALHAATGFQPTTPLAQGMAHFINWFREYTGL